MSTQHPTGLYVDAYGREHEMIDAGGGVLESAVPLRGHDADGTAWEMPYWLPRASVIEVCVPEGEDFADPKGGPE